MTRLVAAFLIVAIITAAFSWLIGEISGRTMWQSIGDVLWGVMNFLLVIAPFAAICYLLLVLLTGDWAVRD